MVDGDVTLPVRADVKDPLVLVAAVEGAGVLVGAWVFLAVGAGGVLVLVVAGGESAVVFAGLVFEWELEIGRNENRQFGHDLVLNSPPAT